MKSMYIGSGDIGHLMSGKNTASHQSLLKRFANGVLPIYNSLASPIDALRTGAILENRYLLTLPDNYFPQYRVVCTEMNVFRSTLDFAKIENGNVIDFDEVKACFIDDFLSFESIKDNPEQLLSHIRKKYKNYYYQVQSQLFCTSLKSCNLVFIAVYVYDDDKNRQREIKPNEYIKVRINRDESIITEIKERGMIFQQIKDCYDL